MKTFLTAALALAMVTPSDAAAQVDPMADVCRVRAEKASGYAAPPSGLTRRAGNTTFRLSGSVAIGASRSSGTPGGYGAPAFAGSAASERREATAESRYSRIYRDCMRTR